MIVVYRLIGVVVVIGLLELEVIFTITFTLDAVRYSFVYLEMNSSVYCSDRRRNY